MSVVPCVTVAIGRASGAARSGTFDVGTSVESAKPATNVAELGLAAFAGGGTKEVVSSLDAATDGTGAVVDDPASIAALDRGVAAVAAGADAATSPPLVLGSGRGAGFAATFRSLDGAPRPGLVALSDARRTHPVRETRTHPAGAPSRATETDVPASSDANVRAAFAPLDRSNAARLPTRGVSLPRCPERRVRSTNPATDTRANAPRVSSTRRGAPSRRRPIARPFGAVSMAADALTTCCWALAEPDVDMTASNIAAARATGRRVLVFTGISVTRETMRIAGWCMGARIHCTGRQPGAFVRAPGNLPAIAFQNKRIDGERRNEASGPRGARWVGVSGRARR